MKNLLYSANIAILALVLLACNTIEKKPENIAQEVGPVAKLTASQLQEYETAYFAAGCFWCVEAIFESVKGVKEVVSGYSGGKEADPTYESVSYGRTTHAEAVEVYYDPEVVSFIQLVQVFFGSHDPTTLNRQGPDRGPQYRSIAFYKNKQEEQIIRAYVEALEQNNVYDDPIVTQVVPYEKFYIAEEFHQDFERRNPNNSYVRNVSIPRLNRFKQNFPEFLKEDVH